MRPVDRTAMMFRKSSYSGPSENCVELARVSEVVAVRDSNDPDGPVLLVPSAAFDRFLRGLR